MVGTRVGIDIRDEMVIAVAVEGNLRQQVVSRVATAPLQDEDALGDALRVVCEQVEASDGDCVSVIPSGHIAFRNLQMPFQSAKKIEQTIAYELETLLPAATEGLLIDFSVASAADQPDVLAAMTDRKFLADYLVDWQGIGVDPTVLEVRNVPLAGWLARSTYAPDCGLLLDLRCDGGEMVMFRDGRVVLVRDIVVEGDMRLDEVRSETCSRFCRSVLNTVRSLSAGPDGESVPEAVFITGPLSVSVEVMDLLRENLGLRVGQVDLAALAAVHIDPSIADQWDGPLMEGALALALRPRRGVVSGFNFRKEEFAVNRPLQRFKKEVAWVAAFAALFGALLAVNAGVEYFYLQRRYNDLDRQVKAIFREALPEVTRIVDPVQQLRVRIREIEKATSGRAHGWAGISVLDFLKEVSVRIPSAYSVKLTRLAVDQEGARVKGETDNFNNVDGIKKNLEASPLFTAVAISSANLDRTGNKVQFELRIQ